jgi:CRP-like cAMP-binding protein
VSEFVRLTNERGGHDNVTVVVVECDGDDVPAPDRFTERHRAIETAGVLAGLDSRLAFHLALAAETYEVSEGTVISREDKPVQALHIVVDGAVQFARRGVAGDEAGPGAAFGETSLVDRWAEAPTVVALHATRYVRITREAILAVGRREPELHEQVLAGFARAVTSKARPAASPR